MFLAAALTFAKKGSIVVPDRPVEPTRAASSIAAKDVLPDWDTREIEALLTRPLFDQATSRAGTSPSSFRTGISYISVAAPPARKRQKAGAPSRGLLFTTWYGINVMIPSLKPVAAWLALWDERIDRRNHKT